MNANLSAVLFAKDARRVARFYVEICNATIRAQDPPPWTDGQFGFFLGFDPEGNVFGMFHAHP